MKKKLMSAVLSVAMAATLLVGCGGSAPAADTSAPAADTAAETKTEVETAAPAEDSADQDPPQETGYGKPDVYPLFDRPR